MMLGNRPHPEASRHLVHADRHEDDHGLVREMGEKPVRREGETENRWVLLDYIDVVVHSFAEEEREYYDLERLWLDAPRIAWEEPDAASSG